MPTRAQTGARSAAVQPAAAAPRPGPECRGVVYWIRVWASESGRSVWASEWLEVAAPPVRRRGMAAPPSSVTMLSWSHRHVSWELLWSGNSVVCCVSARAIVRKCEQPTQRNSRRRVPKITQGCNWPFPCVSYSVCCVRVEVLVSCFTTGPKSLNI